MRQFADRKTPSMHATDKCGVRGRGVGVGEAR